MASAKQIEANRRNAAGPHKMTEEGKAAVRGNALRHGLASQTHVLLPGEDQNIFNQLKQELEAEYNPTTTQQDLLVSEIACSYWRLLRARNMETAGLANAEADFARQYRVNPIPADSMTRSAQLALAFTTNGSMFDKLSRYVASAERSYYRAIRELTILQKQRQNPEPAPAPQPEPVAVSHQAPTEFRSVPQNHRIMTQEDMLKASSRMSGVEFNALLDQMAAPENQCLTRG